MMVNTHGKRFRAKEVSDAVPTSAVKLGYSQLKDKQYTAVSKFVCGKDALVSLQMGSGKFVYYAVLPAVPNLCKHAIPTSVNNSANNSCVEQICYKTTHTILSHALQGIG